jgi:lipopolysaccharide/colanic/teichoic acid biosynthesis glycosyltransferase
MDMATPTSITRTAANIVRDPIRSFLNGALNDTKLNRSEMHSSKRAAKHENGTGSQMSSSIADWPPNETQQKALGAPVSDGQSSTRRAAERDFQPSRLFARKRFQLGTALLLAAVLPWCVRGAFLPGEIFDGPSVHTLAANLFAIGLTFWTRLSVENYPGIRRAYLILPSCLIAHGLTLAWFVFTRLTYDRVGLALGFAIHIAWLYAIFLAIELRIRRRIAVVPFGKIEALREYGAVDWLSLSRPRLQDTRRCDSIVADFGTNLPDEWQEFLAEAALAGKIVYQVKQLSESLTGRVELEHLSENSFGSLVPAAGYFYLKGLVDLVVALLVLPVVLPLMMIIAVCIRMDSIGPALFRQVRVGHAGKLFTVYKFRTMHCTRSEAVRAAAITAADDERITRLGKILRRLRIDELPQIFNILKGEMSWIGPRPEAQVLSQWYTSEIPFYRYRHVVKPGISGWAQVNQGHVADVNSVYTKLQYDFYYIKYFSPWLDALIFFRTLKTMLTGFGAR